MAFEGKHTKENIGKDNQANNVAIENDMTSSVERTTQGKTSTLDSDNTARGVDKSKKKASTKTSIKVIIAVLVMLLLAAGAGIGYLLYVRSHVQHAEQQQATIPQVEGTAASFKVTNPIDFASLQADNSDIYAWLYIPNTKVNYAVCQSPIDDAYYMNHDSRGEYSLPGALYTERVNKTDFSNPVTVIYGHTGYSDLMFATLHDFEDPEFFNENDTLYIYIPGHIMTYRIVSAFMYDDRHILNAFDFYDAAVLQEYFTMVTHPESLVVNAREGITLTTADKLLQLSTCMESWSQGNSRYLVNGVLVNDQLTY